MSIINVLKEAAKKSAELADKKMLIEAVETVEVALKIYSEKRNFWEKLWGKILIAKWVGKLEQQLLEWRKSIASAEKLKEEAEKILNTEILNTDPWQTQPLTNAIGLYQLYSQIIYNQQVIDVIQELENVLHKNQQFQKLVTEGNLQLENRFFKLAIANYNAALELYDNHAVKTAIAKAEIYVYQEKIYESALQQAQQLEEENKLSSAITILAHALNDFPRSDGRELLKKLKSTFQGRENFQQGLKAEQMGNFHTATIYYLKAKSLLANSYDCEIRLSLVAIKTQDWHNAIFYLENVPGEQAAYLRGFAFAQQSNLRLAYREWQNISHPQISQQIEIIKKIAQYKRLEYLSKIEQLVAHDNLHEAEEISYQFIEKFGNDPIVESNLYKHIQPRLKAKIWQDHDPKIIAEQMKQAWSNSPNITNLHNWTIANYYLGKTDINHLFDLMVSLCTSLANIKLDPHLQDVPWLENENVDFENLSATLKKELENLIENVKDVNFAIYLKLRDRYRREILALKLIAKIPNSAIVIHDLFLTPGCYHYFQQQWQHIISLPNIQSENHPDNYLLHSLYTPWGLTIAACVAGDIDRGIQLKPLQKPTTEIEIFADQFVAYHQGYYYLQKQNWQDAVKYLLEAKLQIENNITWQGELDQLCIYQRQAISQFNEHLQFAQFWYNLLGSISARNYLAEYQAESLREQLLQETISSDQALAGLEIIKKIDENNPVVISLIETIEINQELEEIEKLFTSNQLEAMKNKAKLSQYDRIHHIVAEIFMDMVINNMNNSNQENTHTQTVYQLAKWSYELCPHEVKYQEIYQQLKIN